MSCVVWDYVCLKLKGKKYKQNSLPKSYKNDIKILANPGLASSGFEQPGPAIQRIQSSEKLANAVIFLWLGLPSTLIRHESEAFRKRFSNQRNLKHFEIGASENGFTIIVW